MPLRKVHVNVEEWIALAREINSNIVGMTKACDTRDKVHQAIRHRLENPTEEQFIDSDVFGASREAKIYDVKGRQIQITKLHRIGLSCSDVMGADLFYEIPNVKFALIQYKSPSKQLRVKLDEKQLNELKAACPMRCPPSSRHTCGSWYAVRSVVESTYHPACEAENIFADAQSRLFSKFINGLTKEQFHKDFQECRIGARTAPVSVQSFKQSSIENDHVFVHAKQLNPAGGA